MFYFKIVHVCLFLVSIDRTAMLWNPLKEDPSTNCDENMSALLIKTYEGAHGYGVLDLCIASDNTKFATVVCNVNSDYMDSISVSVFFSSPTCFIVTNFASTASWRF